MTQWIPPRLAVIVPTYNEAGNIASLYDKVTAALAGVPFEMIVVDDNSPDGTAAAVDALAHDHANIRVIRRIGRRGLSSACVEGFLSSSAPYLAVIDADHQHDETVLPLMLARAETGDEIVVGTRYAGAGSAGEGLSAAREAGSRLATRLSALVAGRDLSDPMSGFFLLRRSLVEEVAPDLSPEGFKILLDIVVTAMRRRAGQGSPLRLSEVPYTFRPRHAGESKMSPLIVLQFLGLVASKLTGGFAPPSFLLFGLVGVLGIFVHLATLYVTDAAGFNFTNAQLTATLVAMTSNFVLNNELTYADRKLRGTRFWVGLLSFYLVCSFGTLANVSIAFLIHEAGPGLYVAGIAGALMSMVFNYAVTRVFTWR